MTTLTRCIQYVIDVPMKSVASFEELVIVADAKVQKITAVNNGFEVSTGKSSRKRKVFLSAGDKRIIGLSKLPVSELSKRWNISKSAIHRYRIDAGKPRALIAKSR